MAKRGYLERKERTGQILSQMLIWSETQARMYHTMSEIADRLGMVRSTHLRGLIEELVTQGYVVKKEIPYRQGKAFVYRLSTLVSWISLNREYPEVYTMFQTWRRALKQSQSVKINGKTVGFSRRMF